MAALSDYPLFFKQYVRHFRSTGSITPSSRALAKALSRYVSGSERPRKILEVGPGTGAVTRSIVAKLCLEDRFWMVELNEPFVQHLRQRFENEQNFRAVADRCEVLHGRLEDLPCEQTYDVIISGLPLNNFEVSEVENILQVLRRLLAPGGTLSFFEYVAIRPARSLISGRQQPRDCKVSGVCWTICCGSTKSTAIAFGPTFRRLGCITCD